ncbi:MAG TPA: hypothetical protein VLK58_13375 [Conexibacter sp.]|nr:hypothetical protein [Conexibacter sp.]
MDLEEHTLETVGDTCEMCGVRLTTAEQQAVLESGGPALCTVHAAEQLPDPADDTQAPAE